MHLTLYTDYAFRSLIYLGTHPDRTVPVSEISAAYNISLHHVAKVAKTLVRFGFVKAQRGKLGGLRLARAPREINVGEVIRSTEPNLDLLECFDKETNTCSIAGICRLEDVVREARNAFFKVVDGYSLEQIIANHEQLRGLLPLNVRRVAAAPSPT